MRTTPTEEERITFRLSAVEHLCERVAAVETKVDALAEDMRYVKAVAESLAELAESMANPTAMGRMMGFKPAQTPNLPHP